MRLRQCAYTRRSRRRPILGWHRERSPSSCDGAPPLTHRERSTTMDSQLTGVKLRFPRRLAMGAAALSMLAASAFAAPPTAQVNTTGLAVTDTEVIVGQLHSATGTMAISETGSIQAERLAIEQINASGGVLGRQIKIIQEDGASDWPTFAEKARKLLVNDKVASVFGCWTSAS